MPSGLSFSMMQRVIFKECIIKLWNVMFSFSLGSVSTLIRWGGHFCNVCVKRFLLFTTVQKLWKSIKIFQSYDHKCSVTFLWFTVYIQVPIIIVSIPSIHCGQYDPGFVAKWMMARVAHNPGIDLYCTEKATMFSSLWNSKMATSLP